MKKQQTTRTEKTTKAPAQVKSAINDVIQKVGGSARHRRELRGKLETLCAMFKATGLEFMPAERPQYDPPAPDEYEQALCEA